MTITNMMNKAITPRPSMDMRVMRTALAAGLSLGRGDIVVEVAQVKRVDVDQ
jgi:hypothetical protein